MESTEPTLRDKQTTATRDHLLAAAFDLLVDHPCEVFSHEAVARAAGVGARTVYRYFPAQSDLYEALWLQVRRKSRTIFPTEESEIIPSLAGMYRAFDDNEKLIRAVMETPAGARVRARGAEEGRASFGKSLRALTRGLSPSQRRQVRAVFLGLHSAPFWQMLHDRGGLSAAEAIAAATWAAQSLVASLRHGQTKSQVSPNHARKKGDRSK